MARAARATLLILAADPTSELRLPHEVRGIQNGLRGARRRIEVRQLWAATTDDLRRGLLDHRPTFVHFCGHGTGPGGIVLDDRLVTGEALAGLFALFSRTIRCVVLNACYSAVQAEAIARHIDAVIGMRQEIGDDAALEFGIAFYDAIGAGQSVEFAFALACNAIEIAGLPEHLTPKLHLKPAELSSSARAGGERHPPTQRQDWDNAPAATFLLGRDSEAEQLRGWIVDDKCRLVLVQGIGGIGKTDLVTCLARGGNRAPASTPVLVAGIQSDFKVVVWRKLLNAPPPQELFADLLSALGDEQHLAASTVTKQVEAILTYLQSVRALVILDNAESLLLARDPDQGYRVGYEAYGAFFEQVARVPHQSCVLLTSREKLRTIAELEGVKKPVRSLTLAGVGVDEARPLFAEIADFTGSDEQWQRLVSLYQGNPLALGLAARHIKEVFGGDLGKFLAGGQPVFADIGHLLDWHVDRLSADETELMYWLAIEREPVGLATLADDLVSSETRERIASTLQSLQRRLPVEHIYSQQFSLQPVLIEHVTARLVRSVGALVSLGPAALMEHATKKLVSSVRLELRRGEPVLLNAHALIKATAKENVREAQRRLILAPILERLDHFQSEEEVAEHLLRILASWRAARPGEPGYLAGNVINCLTHLEYDLRSRDFSRLRIWQARLDTAVLQGTDFSRSEFRHTTFRYGFGAIFALCYSPDGSLIAAGDGSGDVHLIEAATGKPLGRCIGHADAINAVAFSPDGSMLASAGFDGTLRLWRVADRHPSATLVGHEGWIYSLAFSPDGRELVTAGEDGTLRLWSAHPARMRSTLARDEGFIAAVAFSPDGRRLAFGGSSKVVSVLDLATLSRADLDAVHTGRIRSMTFSPDGSLLASGAEDGRIALWQPPGSSPLAVIPAHSKTVRSLCFTADGRLLASASDDRLARMWTTPDAELLQSFQVSDNRVWAVAFSPGGGTLATGSEDSAIRVWSSESSECLMTVRGYSNKTRALAFGRDNVLLSGGEDNPIRAWDLERGEVTHEMLGHASGVWCAASSADGRWLATGGEDLTVKVWDLASKICRLTLVGHRDWVRSLCFDAEGRLLASAAEDGHLMLWRLDTGACVGDVQAGARRAFALCSVAGGRLVACGGSDAVVRLFDAHDLRLIAELRGHEGWISCMAVAENGALVSASEDGTVRVWDTDRFGLVRTYVAGPKLWCCVVDGDGRIVCGGDDGALRRFGPDGTDCERVVQAHQGAVWSLAISLDGSSLASAGGDASIRLWRAPGLLPVDGPNTLRPPRPYEAMNISGSRGLTPAQREALLALGAIDMQPV